MSKEVSQAVDAQSLEGFVPIARVGDVADPGREVFEIDDRFVVLFHVSGQWHAIDDCCTHDDGPLGEGELDGFTIICPRHGAHFDIRTGAALTMPAVRPTPCHEVKIVGEDVYIRLNQSS